MSKRATKRPKRFAKPAHWDNSPPPKAGEGKDGQPDPDGLDPTRYGDWVKNGLAVDF
jgi:hypothetical protein